MSADQVSGSPHPFDVKTIDYLVRLMAEHDLSVIDLEEGEQRIKLRRGAISIPMAMSAPMMPMTTSPAMPAATGPSAAAPAATSSPAAPTAPVKKLLEIKSPTPGTFYRSSSPDAEAFVKEGSMVRPDSVVCIIEAMKVFNEIPAEVSGKIVEIKVTNQSPVEYGQVLFLVDPE